MKIMATCGICDRPFVLGELIQEASFTGQCPSCGELLAAGYESLLLDTIDRLESAGGEMERMLGRIAAWPRIAVESSSVVHPIEARLGRTRRRIAQASASREPVAA